MKNFLCVISIIILTTANVSVFGQTALCQATFPHKIKKTIVREYNYPATVSYVETTNIHYFAYADASFTLRCHPIDSNIFIRDFKIFEDTVYFCGIDKSNGCHGVWGHFPVADLLSNTLHYNTYSSFTCKNKSVDTLHAIIAYRENGEKHCVTVGTATDGTLVRNGCTIDLTPHSPPSSNWKYIIGITPDGTGEDINHLCLTDNYVVAAGSHIINSDMEYYRVHSRGNLFATGGSQDYPWEFSYYSLDPHRRNTDKFAITHMYGDTVAMAFQSVTGLPSNLQNAVILYVYDMSSLSNGAFNTIYSISVSTGQDSLEVEGLEYFKARDKLVLLLSGNLPNQILYGHGSIIAEIQPGFTNIDLQYHNKITLQSLDRYDSEQNYLCMGFENSDKRNANFYTQPLNSSSQCLGGIQVSGNHPFFMTKQDIAPYIVCTEIIQCNNAISSQPLIIGNPIICE